VSLPLLTLPILSLSIQSLIAKSCMLLHCLFEFYFGLQFHGLYILLLFFIYFIFFWMGLFPGLHSVLELFGLVFILEVMTVFIPFV